MKSVERLRGGIQEIGDTMMTQEGEIRKCDGEDSESDIDL